MNFIENNGKKVAAKKNIEVKREILVALLLTDFPLNVKGLEMESKEQVQRHVFVSWMIQIQILR